jgi:hypothetical protein
MGLWVVCLYGLYAFMGCMPCMVFLYSEALGWKRRLLWGACLPCFPGFCLFGFLRSNARPELLPEAGAQRTLEAVSSRL